ncbi:PAS sensor protein [Streptomyces pluripotens]|uniref:PAS sensor protein n=1 Tax=Streptomyces pluripotens TaxID=1355015 RepID=A0A221NSS6_9ACTN|nr:MULTISPECIES: SpoIIE family protein phosphatase [Streptomyces]ARP68773.1 PAS sensor protein [Streptomyces pluripotens]ASN23029.1 PAS sensor protein [Streptomyces pluripotens]KIE27831.1 PAS/PAC sensor protein [Streptomyces sp. MUSC 125]MCH0558494.1 SpoIIE family protein phosphatase [Streptomyces sp. MUM 16J]
MSRVYPFDDAATARAVINDDGTLVEWNDGARRLLGHPADEVVGRPAVELLAEYGAPAVPSGTRWDGTVGLRHRDGHTLAVWLLAHHRPSHDDRPGDWLVVTPLTGAEPPAADDLPTRAGLIQSPCAIAVFDDELRLRQMNNAMADVIGLPEKRVRGLRLAEIDGRPQSEELERNMLLVLTTGRPMDVETSMPASSEPRAHTWLARMAPVVDAQDRIRGVSLAGHDVTENRRARQRLQVVNEASVRIGTTLDVTRTAQELADVCVPVLADFVTIDLLDPHEQGGEPPAHITAPVTLRRFAHQSVLRGVPEAVLEPGETQEYPPHSPQADSLTAGHTIITSMTAGNMQQWLTWNTTRGERVRRFGIHSSMSVPIRARGLTLGVAVLTRHQRPDSFTADDRLLAEEITARAAVCVDNARRYSRERETALALQRSLLPRTLPRTAALEASSRYLPAARAGVGGDWFDVIPLSGMRVAMVVGDVVGHGVRASAAMGRLRTAVRTLADIDLAPDELLTHLDDLVVRLSEESGGDGSPGEVGATCLYAVYDPVSRRCTLARAGHPPPLLLRPGSRPQQLDLPAGPPLGLGGLPFESEELELPEGTVLALYTDGLVQSREPDVDARWALLREALGTSADSLDGTCDRILHALLPHGDAADDVALLLARTRGLPAAQVATWDIPADPALVAPVRKQVVHQLADWGLGETAFTAELVVSELVTNAIRYGSHPIRLRLIHDATTLIFEVSDTSHTAPHLRRAKTFDEGGRGLLLVAQLTQRWGSRHTAEGKTIWAELPLYEPEAHDTYDEHDA